jgi:citrate lyase subunit beta/citryl-CoA lyase
MTVPRSKLFIHGDSLEGLPEALRAAPDALSFDLEDGVAEAGKADARRDVAAALRATRLAPQVWVRVNGLDSGHLVADILALAGAQVDVVNLPKAESPGDLVLLEHLLRHIEATVPRAQPIRIVPTIESPRGLRHAAAIAQASPRVLALQIGAGDLHQATGIEGRGAGMDMLRAMLSLAAAEAGVAALDSTPHGMDHDLAAFEAHARQARALGFRGKSCMHPAQVAVANRVFGDPALS